MPTYKGHIEMAKSTKVVANLSVATAAAYQEGALRTKSDSYFGQHQSRNVLRGYLSFIISNNKRIGTFRRKHRSRTK